MDHTRSDPPEKKRYHGFFPPRPGEVDEEGFYNPDYKLKNVRIGNDGQEYIWEVVESEEGFKELQRKKKPASERQAGGSHYKDMAMQPQKFCQINKLYGMETAAIKYICRHRLDTKKPGGALDIKKAIHMLEYLLEVEYNEEVLK